jgi:GT2 family glycosyltransferase
VKSSAPPSPPIATIIVVTHNSARWLERQRAALEAQTERRFRVVIVDNASNAGERPQCADEKTGVVQNARNTGFAAANNQAAALADTPYLVFLNPDAFPAPAWLSALLGVAERYPETGAIGSTQVRADAPNLLDGTGDVLHASGLAYRSNYDKVAPPPPLGESFAACAAAMLVRREAFEAVGGFDARYFCFFEDVDLCFRLRLAGWRVLQTPDAIVEHVGGGAGAGSAFAEFHGARNRFWTFIKCMPDALFWPLLPIHLVATIAAVSISMFRGRGFAAWRGFLAGVAGVGPVWRTRRTLQANRKSSAFEIARMLAWSPHVFVGRKPVIRKAAPSRVSALTAPSLPEA